MKTLLTTALFLFSCLMYGQNKPRINLTVDTINSVCFDSKSYTASRYKDTIKQAFIIANAIFNSREFQTLYDTVSFPYWNHCKFNSCKPQKNYKGSEQTMGKEIYDNLFRNENPLWKIYFEKKSKNALGSTCPNTGYTTAYCDNIIDDMRDLPLAYAIAVNLCHEYMHQIGFCHYSNRFRQPDEEHPDPDGYKKDIAYRVGWDAYYILKKWMEHNVKIEGL